MIGSYPSSAGGEEYAVTFDRGRDRRLLVLPALFDEANKLRHFTVEVMRRLDALGIDTFLPDLPGCNESLAPLAQQTLASWREAAKAAAVHFGATHVLTLRGGWLSEPAGIPCIRYSAVSGASVLRALLRARVISGKEAGLQESSEQLLQAGRTESLELAGYRLGGAMVRALETAAPESEPFASIAQGQIGGPGLWLRAEPAHDAEQADALAALAASHLS